VLGKEFKKDAQLVTKLFDNATRDEVNAYAEKFNASQSLDLSVEGKDFALTDKHIKFESVTKTTMEEKYTPHVIEPSFGIGRILYCVFEHCFNSRPDDAQRTFFDFPPLIAPVKTSILPLIKNADLDARVSQISKYFVDLPNF